MGDYVLDRKRQRISQLILQVPRSMPLSELVKELKKSGVLFWNPDHSEVVQIATEIIAMQEE